jgi:hypothetical protein
VRIALRTPLTGRVLAVAAIAAGGIGASVLPVSADVADQSPSVASVRLDSPATLHARGAAITVPVLVVCQPGARAFLSVSVSQNAGGTVANGGASTDIPSCTGGLQDINVTILANSAPFRRGVAFGGASLSVSAPPFETARDQREIRIVRASGEEEAPAT